MSDCPEGEFDRRQFSLRAIYGLASLIGFGISAPAAIYVFGSRPEKKETGWIDAGSVSSLSNGVPLELPVIRIHRDGWKITTEQDTVWVVKNEGTLTAFSPRCTHLGCAYHWDPAKRSFLCPCHGSVFSIDGKVLAGPAPRPLDRFVTKIDGDRLWLGKLQASSPDRSA